MRSGVLAGAAYEPRFRADHAVFLNSRRQMLQRVRSRDRVALWMQNNGLLSGEGGAIGLASAAFCAGWTVDWESLSPLWALVQHETGGPK